MAKSAGYVSADYLRKVAALGEQVKQLSYELMIVTPGDQCHGQFRLRHRLNRLFRCNQNSRF